MCCFLNYSQAEQLELSDVIKSAIEEKGQIDTGFMILGFHGAKASDNKEKLNDIHEKEAKSGRKSGKIIR